MITKRYLTGGINGATHAYNNTTALVGATGGYDRAGNKLYERHLESEGRSHLYQPFNNDGSFGVGYDSANRLLQYQRGILSGDGIPYLVDPGASIDIPTSLPGADQLRTYGLDGLGNWKTSNFTLVGSGGGTSNTAEVRQHNYLNEITSVRDTTSGTPTTKGFSYDKNGNLLNDGVRKYQWDALNRLVQVSKVAGGAVIASYVYDALGRRIQKTINDLGGGNGGLTGDILAGTTDYLYDAQQIVEERNDAAPTVWTKVNFWGQYIDELMFFAVPGETVPTTYRVLSDLLYRSVALVDTSNTVVEAYDCDAYGNTLCFSGPGSDGLWFTDDDVRTNNPINTTIFTGRQFDPESQIYYYRARYYSPVIGRFITRDPLPDAEKLQGPNLYQYANNNAVRLMDYSGLGVWNYYVNNVQINTATVSQVDVTYTLSSDESKCCFGFKIERYVKKIFGIQYLAGTVGSYYPDDSPENGGGSTLDLFDKNTRHAESDLPEGNGYHIPGVGVYRFSATYSFKWIATCTDGPSSGKVLSTATKDYHVTGHFEGSSYTGSFN